MTMLFKRVLYVVFMMLGATQAMASEEAKYSVELQDEQFELRLYDAHILAQVLVDGEFSSAGNKAFNRLFKYITGNNIAQQSIDMTTPVTQGAASSKIAMTTPVGQQHSAGQWAVSFMMPATASMATLPLPKDPSIQLVEVPAQHIAVVRYSGLWREKTYQQQRAALERWVKQHNLAITGEPIWARYNPPFTLWFLRRNEVLIPVALPQ